MHDLIDGDRILLNGGAAVHSPLQPRHSRLSIVMLATIPMVLAAITVWIFRDALAQNGGRTLTAPSAVSSPPSPSR